MGYSENRKIALTRCIGIITSQGIIGSQLKPGCNNSQGGEKVYLSDIAKFSGQSAREKLNLLDDAQDLRRKVDINGINSHVEK